MTFTSFVNYLRNFIQIVNILQCLLRSHAGSIQLRYDDSTLLKFGGRGGRRGGGGGGGDKM